MDVYVIEGPVCAIDEGQGRTTTLCAMCGRGTRRQTGSLSVALVCSRRSVWVTDSNAVLIVEALAAQVSGMPGVRLERIAASWREGLAGASAEPPTLFQLRAESQMHASSSKVEVEPCECGSVRSVPFDSLEVELGFDQAAIWQLAESPEVLIVGDDLLRILVTADPALEFAEVRIEGPHQS